MAKTQYSFSDDATQLGAPEGFEITIRELEAKTGLWVYCCVDRCNNDDARFTKATCGTEYGCN